MRKIAAIILLFTIICLTVSCSSKKEIIRVSCSYYDVNEVSETVREWAESNSSGGIYLAKKVNSKGLETYYVNIKEMPINGFSVSNDRLDGLKLEVEISNDAPYRSDIHEIITINRKAKYLLVNGERIDTSSILLISDK